MLNLAVHTRYALQTFLRRDLRVSEEGAAVRASRVIFIPAEGWEILRAKKPRAQPEARERAVGSASGPVSLILSYQQVGSDTGVPIPH